MSYLTIIKDRFRALTALFLMAGSLLFLISMSAHSMTREPVVLLHGLARTSGSMEDMP